MNTLFAFSDMSVMQYSLRHVSLGGRISPS